MRVEGRMYALLLLVEYIAGVPGRVWGVHIIQLYRWKMVLF